MEKAKCFALASILLGTPIAQAQDLCVQYNCTGPNGYPYTLDSTVPPPNVQCNCLTRAHIPTANEIAAASSAEVKQAILQGMNEAVKAALIEIQRENDKREARIYEQMAALQRANAEQIKVLIDILRSLQPAPVKP